MAMEEEEAKARMRIHTKELLSVIEAMYEIRISNIESVIEFIIGETLDADRILTICTALNSWVALNSAPYSEVELPLEVVEEFVRRIEG